jgi:anti-anti-sigma regulatory factor
LVLNAGITVRRIRSAYVVRLPREVDASALPQFNRTMARLVDGEKSSVIIDLAETSFLHSRMIGALAGWHKHAEHFGRGQVVFAIGNRSSQAGNLFATLMGTLVPQYATLDDALAAAANGNGRGQA